MFYYIIIFESIKYFLSVTVFISNMTLVDIIHMNENSLESLIFKCIKREVLRLISLRTADLQDTVHIPV